MKLKKLNWTTPKVVVGPTIWGESGVFAVKPIAKDEAVVVYGGHVVTQDEFYTFSPIFQKYFYQIGDDLFFGPTSLDNLSEGEMINHSCSPNTGFISVIHLVAMRDVFAGEQVTVDYALLLTESIDDLDCLCGSPNCRGRVTGEDWKLPGLQARYRGYFQPYIEEKIKLLSGDKNAFG